MVKNSKRTKTKVVRIKVRKTRTKRLSRKRMTRSSKMIVRSAFTGLTPFERCVYGPVNMSGTASGVPDGSNLPSIVIEHRYVVTIIPDLAGRISFAHVASPLGSFAIRHGKITVPLNVISASGDQTSFLAPNPAFSFSSDTTKISAYQPATVSGPVALVSSAYDGYHLVPFSEWLGNTSNTLNQLGGAGTFGVDSFRIISSVGSFSFTGSSFTNAGVSAVAREDVKLLQPQTDVPETLPNVGGTLSPWQSGNALSGTPPGLTPGGPLQNIATRGPNGLTGVSMLSGVVIAPVTQGGDLINVPTDFGYQPIRMSVTELADQAGQYEGGVARPFTQMAVYSGGPAVCEVPQPGIGHAPTTFVCVEGMQVGDTATVTYTARTCVEYQIKQTSSVHRFARLGPPANAVALDRVKALSRLLPASKAVTGPAGDGWLSHAIGWYTGTMKNIMSKQWEIGSRALGMIPQARAANAALQSATSGMQQLSMGNSASYNIHEVE